MTRTTNHGLTISQLEKESTPNLHYSGVSEIYYSDFRERVLGHDSQIRRDLFEGKIFIVRSVHPTEEIVELRKATHDYGQTAPPSFHKFKGIVPTSIMSTRKILFTKC